MDPITITAVATAIAAAAPIILKIVKLLDEVHKHYVAGNKTAAADAAIHFVEEEAAAYALREGTKMASELKLQTGIREVQAALPKVHVAEARVLVKSAIGRAAGLGASSKNILAGITGQ